MIQWNWHVSYWQKSKTEVSYCFHRNWWNQNLSFIWNIKNFIKRWDNDVIIYNLLRKNIREPCAPDKQDQIIFCIENKISKMVIIIYMVWRRSCFVLSHEMNTKDLVSIETLSSLFLSLSTGGGWKRFWDGQTFLYEPMKDFVMFGGCCVLFCVLPLNEGPLSHCFMVWAHESTTRVRDEGRVWRLWRHATHDQTSRTRNKKWDRKVRKTKGTTRDRDKEGRDQSDLI